jgi:ParB/RepB/Spo0J family partition protein
MNEQLSLIPEKLISPKARKVVLTELPENLIGADPEPEFIESVRKYGILQPIVLIEQGDAYQVAFGRRRIKAARTVGFISIPAHIYPQGSMSAQVLTLIENRHRSDNLPAQLDAIATLRLSATPEEICLAVGMTQAELNKAIKLLNELTPELREAMKEGRIKTTTAQKAAKLPIEHQKELAQQDLIKAKDLARYEPAPPTKTVELLSEPQPMDAFEINSGDHVRGKNSAGEMIEGVVDLAGRTKIKLSTGEMLEMETVERLEADSEELEPAEAIETHPENPSVKVSKQSWKVQAKTLVEQLLQVVPEDEELRPYLELMADALKVRS